MTTPKHPAALDNPRSRILVRSAKTSDIPALAALSSRVYAGTGLYGYTEGALTGQINNYPDGQFVVVVGDQIVGYCATFRISEEIAFKRHTWTEITGTTKATSSSFRRCSRCNYCPSRTNA